MGYDEIRNELEEEKRKRAISVKKSKEELRKRKARIEARKQRLFDLWEQLEIKTALEEVSELFSWGSIPSPRIKEFKGKFDLQFRLTKGDDLYLCGADSEYIPGYTWMRAELDEGGSFNFYVEKLGTIRIQITDDFTADVFRNSLEEKVVSRYHARKKEHEQEGEDEEQKSAFASFMGKLGRLLGS